MVKRKRVAEIDEVFPVIWMLLSGIVLMVIFTLLIIDMQDDAMCIDFGEVDFVMYGVDGARDARSELMVGVLGDMDLSAVERVPEGVVRHMDVAAYRAFDPVGTLLFWHEAGMGQWYVTVNDGNRESCGVYAVEMADMLRVFDAIRSD